MAVKEEEHERSGVDGVVRARWEHTGPPVAVAVAVKELNLRFEIVF